MRLDKYIGIICLFFLSNVVAQETENIHLSNRINHSFQAIKDTTDAMHSSVKPYLKKEFKNSENLGYKIPSKSYFSLLPTLDFSSGFDLATNNYVGFEGAGANLFFEPNKKIGFNVQYNYIQTGGLNYVANSIDSLKVIDGFGRAYKYNSGRHYSNQAKGYMSYSPNEIFNFQLGVGHHFWGDGYRSLLLSDNASPMPYFRISTDVWRIKYINLYAMQKDVRGLYEYNKKFTASHYLDWSINKKISLSLFETVVWLQKDTLLSRGLELNYLNPIIFYRPVEYAQGSADNVLMGLNFKVKASKKTTFYSQIILDEFLLAQIKADTGWWANKYGAQLGVKSYDIAGIKGLYAQIEFNGVRPFTYSHSNNLPGKQPINTIQNYAHANQPMAHPLGADFFEYLVIIRYQKDKIVIENKTNLSYFGSDSTSQSYGGDLYKSYSLRAKEYRNHMIQGVRNELFQNDLNVSYNVNKNYNLWLTLGYIQRIHKNMYSNQSTSYVYVSLKSSLFNRYYDY